jgi:hypothetical protein
MIPFPFQLGGFGSSLPVASGDTDPNFANVSLLLHMDGTDGSTTFTDSSSSPKTVTVFGNSQIDTSISKFGGGSGIFDGTGDYLTVPDSDAFELGSTDFTIELFLYVPTGAVTSKAILNKGTWNVSAVSSYLIYHGGTDLSFYSSSNNSSWDIASNQQFTASLSKDTWHHVALVRNGNTFYGFLNGTQSFTFTSSASLSTNSEPLNIASGSAGTNAMQCCLAELRITKGVARYTANFTPPAAPFPNN